MHSRKFSHPTRRSKLRSCSAAVGTSASGHSRLFADHVVGSHICQPLSLSDRIRRITDYESYIDTARGMMVVVVVGGSLSVFFMPLRLIRDHDHNRQHSQSGTHAGDISSSTSSVC